jgi:hypothetical protein
MKGVAIHAGLLLLALLLAIPTWTRERTRPTDIQGSVMWDRDTTELVSIGYRAAARDVEITRRVADDGIFLWGREVVSASGAGSATSDTATYPVGVAGSELMRGLAQLRVVRDLGAVDSTRAKEYGLSDSGASIVLGFVDGERLIHLGDSIYGAADRYAMDRSTGRAFVLPGALVRPLRIGSGALRERSVHHFQDSDVAGVRVEALGRQREMERSGNGRGAAVVWTDPAGPGGPDLTFANFMERVGQLAIAGFEDDVAETSLEQVLRLEYADSEGDTLGFLELFRDLASGAYYLRSERTRVPARTIQAFAERVEQDLPQIF